MWHEVHRDGLDEFYDQGGIGELTIPVDHQVTWDRALSRPEMDKKDATIGQPEVYSPPYSGVGFLPFKIFKWWCYTDSIPVTPGRRTRGKAISMIVAHGVGGDPTVPGACGMRAGVSEGMISDPLSGGIIWSDWWVVRDSLANERVWQELITPEFLPVSASVRLWIQCNADVAASISAGHWDDEIVEQWVEGTPPIPPLPPSSSGPFSVQTYIDGQLVAEGEFNVQVESLRIVPAGTGGVQEIQVARQSLSSNRLRQAWRALWMRR